MTTKNKIAVLLLSVLIPCSLFAKSWEMQPIPLSTRWAADVSATSPWPEYPRPQLVRPTWQNLNGLWDYVITPLGSALPKHYSGTILVPFPLESGLSGVKQPLKPDQLLWYRRTIKALPRSHGERTLLHFGAVDYEATVYLNGKPLKTHSGGYQNFTIDITDSLKPDENELVVSVYDPTETGPNPRGKQNLHAQWMYYSASSGIWQTVWIEQVPATYIESLKLVPDVDRSELSVNVAVNGELNEYVIEATVLSGGQAVRKQTIDGTTAIQIDQPRLWSPDDPYLYDLRVRLLKGDRVIDDVTSYFGMRKIALKKDTDGRPRIQLNNRYVFNLGVVDQGYWPDGLYTAPSDAALKFDVQAAKAYGFNTVRKHIKIEQARWYYHCDKLGLLVWQDMPSSGNDSPVARAQFEREIKENLVQLQNHPSIISWVLFNEGWGAYDQSRLAQWMKELDPTRVLNGHSGPYDHVVISQWLKTLEAKNLLYPLGTSVSLFDTFQDHQYQAPANWKTGDLVDLHYYPGPKMFSPEAGIGSITGEHGSFGVYVEGHVWNEFAEVGKGLGGSLMPPRQMSEAYGRSMKQIKDLESRGLTGSAYFQLYDVENEHQGLLTYDRAFSKVPIEDIERSNAILVPRSANYTSATAGFSAKVADQTGEADVYLKLLAEYRDGRHDQTFLKRFALMAQRQKDKASATDAANKYIAQAPQPFSKDTWMTAVALAQTSSDKCFELLRARTEEADRALGPEVAQKKLLEIIQREDITPYFQSKSRSSDWNGFEREMAKKYGNLGREAVYGARMMEHLSQSDWSSFGVYYAKYFKTAKSRTPYLTHNLAHQVLEHVDNSDSLETAALVMETLINTPRESAITARYDPSELDTYANLLERTDRFSEALEWQHQAVLLSDGRDADIVENLRKMKARCEKESVRRCNNFQFGGLPDKDATSSLLRFDPEKNNKTQEW